MRASVNHDVHFRQTTDSELRLLQKPPTTRLTARTDAAQERSRERHLLSIATATYYGVPDEIRNRRTASLRPDYQEVKDECQAVSGPAES